MHRWCRPLFWGRVVVIPLCLGFTGPSNVYSLQRVCYQMPDSAVPPRKYSLQRWNRSPLLKVPRAVTQKVPRGVTTLSMHASPKSYEESRPPPARPHGARRRKAHPESRLQPAQLCARPPRNRDFTQHSPVRVTACPARRRDLVPHSSARHIKSLEASRLGPALQCASPKAHEASRLPAPLNATRQ